MPYNPKAYNTLQYEQRAVGDSPTKLTVGTAVKIIKFPVAGAFGGVPIFQVAAAGDKDDVFGVVSQNGESVYDGATNGKIAPMNSALIPVLMNTDAVKGDYIKVKTMDGKWEKCAMGEIADALLQENTKKGEIGWAMPVKLKV